MVCLACVGGHVGSSMLGYLTLPWVMTSELYPLRFRGHLGGITTSLAQMLTFATIKMYPELDLLVGIECTMWIFAGSAIMGAAFALTILPETRGRSLDHIESAFSSKSKTGTNADQTLPTVVVRSKQITLQRFASIADEKHNVSYAYDNFCLDLTNDDAIKMDKDLVKNNFVKDRDASHPVSLEHVYI